MRRVEKLARSILWHFRQTRYAHRTWSDSPILRVTSLSSFSHITEAQTQVLPLRCALTYESWSAIVILGAELKNPLKTANGFMAHQKP